jgi:hypothetical protein
LRGLLHPHLALARLFFSIRLKITRGRHLVCGSSFLNESLLVGHDQVFYVPRKELCNWFLSPFQLLDAEDNDCFKNSVPLSLTVVFEELGYFAAFEERGLELIETHLNLN